MDRRDQEVNPGFSGGTAKELLARKSRALWTEKAWGRTMTPPREGRGDAIEIEHGHQDNEIGRVGNAPPATETAPSIDIDDQPRVWRVGPTGYDRGADSLYFLISTSYPIRSPEAPDMYWDGSQWVCTCAGRPVRG